MIELASILAVLLFRFGYWICSYFYEKGTVDWWDLRFTIFTVIFILCFYIARFGDKISIITKNILLIGFVYLGGDIVDRYYFEITSHNGNDMLLDLFAIIVTIKTTTQYATANRME